ncbi:Uncharacterized protein TPAR_00775, partial [Tolypocladium paradoxum]
LTRSTTCGAFPRLTSFSSVISSKPFWFVVGPQKREFTIHSALVAHQPRALDTMVNGGMREAQDGYATWDHVDEQTFIRFSQYAYTGDYDPTDPEASTTTHTRPNEGNRLAVSDEDNYQAAAAASRSSKELGQLADYSINVASGEKPERFALGSAFASGTEPKPEEHVYSAFENPTKRKRLWDEFKNSGDSGPPAIMHPIPLKITNPRQRDTEVFLSDAGLYVFADCYGIAQLAELSFRKLHLTLVAFELHDQSVGDVTELLQYCYVDAVPARLRELVVHFVSCHVEKLWKSEEFRKLLEEHGELSRALVGKLLYRLD